MDFFKGRGTAGRCKHRPLRKRNKRCNGRATARVAPTKVIVGADDPVRPGPITQRLVGQGPCALPGVRETNPPVTASPCQPPLGKGAKGTGERIATAGDRSRRNSRVIPRPVRRLVVGIRNTPAQIQRGTDCHSQCAHWLRNDREFCKRCGRSGRCRHRPLRKRYKRCNGRATARVAPTEGLQGVRCGEKSPVPSSLQNNFFFVAPIHATNVFFRS